MSLRKAYTSTRIIETLENYAIADKHAISNDTQMKLGQGHSETIYQDEQFWDTVLHEPEQYWNARYDLYECAVSHWVPRVPGLFWAKGSEAIRKLSESEVALKGDGWKEYNPPGKSGKVLGGIGTFLFPPDNTGDILVSLSFSGNASVGIPALISSEVIESFNIQQGDTLLVKNVPWIKMAIEWAQRFPSIRGIPRGYLLIRDPRSIQVSRRNSGVQFQPCTIMEYESAAGLFWDYVFVTVDNLNKNYRREMQTFFEYYRTKEGRNGKYLIAADIATPLFDAIYSSPDELSKVNRAGQSQLTLINERIHKESFKGRTIDEIIRFMTKYYLLPEAVFALAQQAGIHPGKIEPGPSVQVIVQVVDFFSRSKNLEQLIDAIAIEHPEILN